MYNIHISGVFFVQVLYHIIHVGLIHFLSQVAHGPSEVRHIELPIFVSIEQFHGLDQLVNRIGVHHLLVDNSLHNFHVYQIGLVGIVLLSKVFHFGFSGV